MCPVRIKLEVLINCAKQIKTKQTCMVLEIHSTASSQVCATAQTNFSNLYQVELTVLEVARCPTNLLKAWFSQLPHSVLVAVDRAHLEI